MGEHCMFLVLAAEQLHSVRFSRAHPFPLSHQFSWRLALLPRGPPPHFHCCTFRPRPRLFNALTLTSAIAGCQRRCTSAWCSVHRHAYCAKHTYKSYDSYPSCTDSRQMANGMDEFCFEIVDVVGAAVAAADNISTQWKVLLASAQPMPTA